MAKAGKKFAPIIMLSIAAVAAGLLVMTNMRTVPSSDMEGQGQAQAPEAGSVDSASRSAEMGKALGNSVMTDAPLRKAGADPRDGRASTAPDKKPMVAKEPERAPNRPDPKKPNPNSVSSQWYDGE
jgi:Flp pilus assembly protein CpaB